MVRLRPSLWSTVKNGVYRDHSEHGVDYACSYGGVDRFSYTSRFKYTCGVIKHLGKEIGREREKDRDKDRG